MVVEKERRQLFPDKKITYICNAGRQGRRIVLFFRSIFPKNFDCWKQMMKSRYTGGSLRFFISFFIAVLLANLTLCFPRVAACFFFDETGNISYGSMLSEARLNAGSMPAVSRGCWVDSLSGLSVRTSAPDTVLPGTQGKTSSIEGAALAEGSSDETFSVRVWSLQDCIDYARENNLQVLSARLDLQSSEVQLKSAKASRWPSLSFSSSQGFTSGNKYNDNGEFVTESQYTGTYSLSTNMTLYNGGRIHNTIKQQEVLTQANSLLVEKARNDIELSVTAAFLEVLYAMESLQADSAVLESSMAQLRQAEARYRAGAVSQSEYAQIAAQYETDNYNYVVSEANVETRLLELKQLLELGLDERLEVETPDTESFDLLQELPGVGIVYEAALSLMPEIKASELQIQASGYAEKVARAEMIPSLSFSAAVGTGYYTSAQFAFLNQLGRNLNENINVGISIPIYQRRQAKSSIETAKLNTRQAQIDLQSTQKSLLKEVEQAWQDARSAQSRYMAAVRNHEASKLSYDLALKEYEVGENTFVDVLSEKSTYLAAVEEMLKAKYQTVLALRLLAFYMGSEA